MASQELTIRRKMNKIYLDICGFDIPNADVTQVRQSRGSPVYGEINFAALEKLLTHLALTPTDVFYDLGSGVGKVVLQTALTTPMGRVVGIELSTNRFMASVEALNRAQQFDDNLARRVAFLNEDMLAANLSDATVIYTCSTAFSISFFTAVVRNLTKLTHVFRLVTPQELPLVKNFRLLKTLRLDMSWARNTAVYIYERAC